MPGSTESTVVTVTQCGQSECVQLTSVATYSPMSVKHSLSLRNVHCPCPPTLQNLNNMLYVEDFINGFKKGAREAVVSYFAPVTAVWRLLTGKRSKPFVVKVVYDTEPRVFVAECAALAFVTEAPTFDAIVERVWAIAPEMAQENGRHISPQKLRLRFELDQSWADIMGMKEVK